MFKCLYGLCAAVLLGFASASHAELVSGLYAATVPVANQSDSSMKAAASAALAEVLVKVSGSEEALDHPLVVKALPAARDQVQKYAFERSPGADEGLFVRFEFENSFVKDLLVQAQLPLWTANRPRVLVWMVVEQAGERQLVSSLEQPELAARLLRAFERRGVPARLPLFDLRDTTAIDVGDVWDQRSDVISNASGRYGVEDVLVGRVVVLSSGRWAGDWSYLRRGLRLDRTGNADDAAGFLQSGVSMVAEDMAARYAIAPASGAGTTVPMTVAGVSSFADYSAIVSWLEGLELIEHANVQQINGDRIELGLSASADAAQLGTIIELNRRLQPVSGASGGLVYQWAN